jgi:hypothetical protein
MYFRLAILVGLSVCVAGAALAQSSSKNRLDLGELRPFSESSPSAYSQLFVGFRDVEVRCPEQHGVIEIKSGLLSLHRAEQLQLRRYSLSELTGGGPRPLDDHQWQYQVGNAECSITLSVKLQLRSGSGEWVPAILPWLSRPGVSKDAKMAWMRDAMARARDGLRIKAPSASPDIARSFGNGGSTSVAFFFDEIAGDQPQPKCFHAIGTYDINPRGVIFAFLGGPGDINRFVVERKEINRYATRLDFIGGECRLQVTIGGSTWYNFDWAPLEIE